jgi:hypothetical protein
MKRKPAQFVLLNADPHKTAHFWEVTSERFRGTFCECETFERKSGYDGYIWRADLWDAGKPKAKPSINVRFTQQGDL